ncbi:hypothetical protein NIES267_73500 (plasmid) [Calothrix parasitica NIES-267]|uniref:Uncharacterized protein n=1 Tax=Calothrix parasitica NIES-267 TaxID=1973488 RepID=A0A1Z4M2Y8_9CYAN|nr:hypothetical protein NIES267_73500 [Calothrix parasitica NIES-267]
MSTRNFKQAYHQLEICMQDFANKNGEIYVPNIAPVRPADYIFIAMQPSLGEWAKDEADAKKTVEEGFRNFVDGFNTMILHFAIRKYLCKDNQTYHLTDLSKAAMKVDDRTEGYDNWYPLLLHEMNLVASPNAKVFAVGAQVFNFLQNKQFPWEDCTQIISYSGQAVRHWDKAIKGHEEEFEKLQDAVTDKAFLNLAETVIESSGMPKEMGKQAFEKLRKSKLTLSRHKLMFNYKLAFEAVDKKYQCLPA